jgi:hypothetical protein
LLHTLAPAITHNKWLCCALHDLQLTLQQHNSYAATANPASDPKELRLKQVRLLLMHRTCNLHLLLLQLLLYLHSCSMSCSVLPAVFPAATAAALLLREPAAMLRLLSKLCSSSVSS